MPALTIGRVARLAGVGVETVRFYAREGLIAEPPRPASGYRHYAHDTVPRIQFILRAKALGFTLKEIKELLSLRLDPDTTCRDIKARADAKIADVAQRIQSLQRMRRTLMELSRACSGSGNSSVDECPILRSLVQQEIA